MFLAIACVGSDSIPTRNPSQATNDMSATAITESASRIRNEEIGGEIANIAPEFEGLNGWHQRRPSNDERPSRSSGVERFLDLRLY